MGDYATATEGPAREVRTERETARGPARGAVSRRRVDAPVADVWALFADPERMRLWSPDVVTGEFRLGGEFSMKDNASGEVLRCEPPRLFRVSWLWEASYSEVEVRFSPVGDDAAVVEIEHLMQDEELAGADMSVSDGVVAAGTGWDFTLECLDRYVRGEIDEPDEELPGRSEQLWRQVVSETEGG